MCKNCTRPVSACYCHLIERLNNQYIHLKILRHPDEVRNPLGTAKILKQSLSHCQMYDGISFSSKDVLDTHLECYLLYPGTDVVSIQETLSENVLLSNQEKVRLCLIVLDGTWRNTREILINNPYLNDLPRVSMDFPPSRYIVRKAPDISMVSTVESVVYMLDELYHRVGCEGKSFQPILKAFDYMVAYQIQQMGPEVFRKNYVDPKNR